MAAGPVYAWGAGTNNTGGAQNYGQSLVPASVTNAVAIAGGGVHSVALHPEGRVTAWGNAAFAQSAVPASATNLVAITAGYTHTVGLRSNGTVLVWGGSPQYGTAVIPVNATNIAAFDGGWYHTLALRSNGTVVAWGAGTNVGVFPNLGQSMVPTGLGKVVAVAGGGLHSLALRDDGQVVAWGSNAAGQTNVPASLSNVVAIAAGASNSLALRRDGTVVAWGGNAQGQNNVPANLSNAVAIACGAAHGLALRADGTVAAWGLNASGQTNVPAGLSNCVAISAGDYHNLVLVNQAPATFISRPYPLTVYQGASASFTAAAVGSEPLTYQWQFNGQDLPDATNQSLTIPNTRFEDAGSYRMVVTHAQGAITSAPAALTIHGFAPFFVQNPAGITAVPSSNAVFTAEIAGLSPLTYQWQRFGTNLPNQTNATLILDSVGYADEGPYVLAVTNAFGFSLSAPAILKVLDLGESLNAPELAWSSSPNLPWKPQTRVSHDGVAAAGPTFPGNQNGYSTLQTVITGPGKLDFWYFSTFNLSPPGFTFAINGQVLMNGFVFPQWTKATYYLSSGTNYLEWSIFRNSPVTLLDFYLDEVSFVPGGTAAQITVPLSDRTVPAGSNVTFSATTIGTPPLAYRWQFQGNDLTGATNSSLTLTNVQASAIGQYSVFVTNSYGSATASASVTVTSSPPVILAPPVSIEMVSSGLARLQVLARGSDPLSYQWRFGGADLPGATTAELRLVPLLPAQGGDYQVVISNAFGSVTSATATVQVAPSVIVGWGSVFTSTPNPPAGLTNVLAVAAGNAFSAALRTDGTVFVWGWNAFGKLALPSGLSNVIALATGENHGSTLRADGTVINWGDPFFDAAAVVPEGLSNVVRIAANGRLNLAARSDNSLIAWGENSPFSTQPPSPLEDIVEIGAGPRHGLAVRQDGSVVAWGWNLAGQCDVPADLTNTIAVTGGLYQSAALREDGTVTAWGNLSSFDTNALSQLTNVVAISANQQFLLALRADGTVAAFGVTVVSPGLPPEWLTNVVAISAGNTHGLALLNDGSPYVTRHPWSQSIRPGAAVTFKTRALGHPPFHYQWEYDGVPLAGATNSTLTISNVAPIHAGKYACTITNAISSVRTIPATLNLLPRGPFRLTHAGWDLDGSGKFALRVEGLSGHGELVLYASTNLTAWQAILTNPPAVGVALLNDPNPTAGPLRFYKVEER